MKGRHSCVLVTVMAIVVGCGGTTEKATSTQIAVTPVPERHIALDGQPNFRDVGGYQTTNGRMVKWGEVYRSGEIE